MVITLLVFMIRKGAAIGSEYDNQISDAELAKFNGKFEIYDKDNNNFMDIITVCNMAYDVNKKNSYDAQNSVKIKLFMTASTSATYSILADANLKKGYFFKGDSAGNQEYIYNLVSENTKLNDEGNYINTFKCIYRNYNKITGKIDEMHFKKI